MEPVTLTHIVCGRETEAVVACEHCREDIGWGEVRTDPIPVRLPARVTEKSA